MRNPKNQTPPTQTALGASFRDPAGFIFRDRQGQIFRQINAAGMQDYEQLMNSGLYESLESKRLLVSHEQLPKSRGVTEDARAVIKPETVPYISYPFEWSFSQLQDAALLTLQIQKLALKHGMTLKDASAYNIQFLRGKPVFIDTLSFEAYTPGTPWQAYRQFCQHFLAPLALMSYTDINMSQLSRIYLDGVPLDLAAKLLPSKAKFKLGLAMHVVVHGRAQQAKATEHQPVARQVSQQALEAIIDSLERTVRKLKAPKAFTEWGDYYDNTNYTPDAADEKTKRIKALVKPLGAKTAIDLGGNNGRYSRVLNELGLSAICTDIDPNAVEANYRYVKRHGEEVMLPLLVDLTNPGGALGWQNEEREAVHERLQCDVVMALALIHHLAISNNLPFNKIAEYFSRFGTYLVIEFVPKPDSQVQKLLATRKDIFPEYDEEHLKQSFGEYYDLQEEVKIKGTKRTLYLFKRK